MIHVISVEPMAEGWAVSQPTIENPQVFASGAKAEDAARRLGESLRSAGASSEIRVYTRDGALAGRFICAV